MTRTEPSLLEDSPEWLVIAKPAGWLTIPGRGERAATSPVLSEWAKEKNHGEIWTVHRLDVETSGVILFAKTPEAHRKASLWFQNHEVKKQYDCLAMGQPSLPVMRIQKPIEGAPALSQVEVKERYDRVSGGAFLGRVRILTGKRHQIRIHLSGLGHSLLGDPTYGGPREIRLAKSEDCEAGAVKIERVALHAARLELPNGQALSAPWPEDFARWCETLRRKGTS